MQAKRSSATVIEMRKPESDNIVELAKAQPQPAVSGSLKPYFKHTNNVLEKMLKGMFERIDDALFDMAEKAASNSEQTQFFEGMRELRREREKVTKAFFSSLGSGYATFSARKSLENLYQTKAKKQEQELSLVEDRELEETLAISDMSAKASTRLSAALHALNSRFAALHDLAELKDENNPIGPDFLCNAFKVSCKELDTETPVLIVVYKLFDREVLGNLEQLYNELNDKLAKAGILPELRYQPSTPAPRQSAAPPQAQAAEGQANEPVQQAQPDAESAAQMPPSPVTENTQAATALFNTVRELLAARHGGAAGAPLAGGQSAGQQQSGVPDLINALTLLQTQLPSLTRTDAKRENYLAPDLLKQSLKAQMEKLSDTPMSESVPTHDSDTIDLVGMLFEYILQDRNLPDTMQATLSRLQIPFLKVALMDQQLFASANHPARRLLDELAKAALSWSKDSDKGNQVNKKINEVVDRVCDDFDDDQGLFDEVLDDFRQFIGKAEKRAAVAEKRATEATKGKEKLQAARTAAAEEIEKRLEDVELPDIIQQILEKPWANHLVLCHLRHGPASREWRDALEFADDLLWTGKTKHSAADVARLQSMLPNLSKRLRAGLENVAYHLDDIKTVFSQLKATFQSLIAEAYRDQLHMPSVKSSAEFKIADLKPVQLPSEPIVVEKPKQPTPEELAEKPALMASVSEAIKKQLEELQVGDWLEITDEEGGKSRIKLSWKSPITGKFLFVNQKGLKVADKSIHDLTDEIASGSTTVLDSAPLVERALDAIAQKLQEGRNRNEKPEE